jgi:tRNA(fMet)-specific endonuclease VapC
MSRFILDTDILSLFQQGHPEVCRHIASHPLTQLATTVISIEEQLSGWYILLRRAQQRDQLARVYQKLADTVPFLAKFPILGFSEPAILRFEHLASMKLNVRAMDLRIAAITLEAGGVLVTRNLRDFRRVPGLVIEAWTV